MTRSGNDTKKTSELNNRAKTVQEYIDETPFWEDGTEIYSIPMTSMQWRIWGMATAGKFFEGMVVFITGVALPLIVMEFKLDASAKGTVSAAVLFGILIGASALGSLSDRFGRKLMFIVEMLIFTIFLLVITFTNQYYLLLLSLFGMGTALGCDYPTAHMVISESIPSKARGKLVLSAFAFQSVGALAGTAVSYFILYENPSIGSWRWMYASAIIPAVAVLIGRFFITDSSHWLVARGKINKAEREIAKLLHRTPIYPKAIKLSIPEQNQLQHHKIAFKGYLALFSKKNLRATILASVPWFIQDLGTYGIGIFTPTILATAIGAKTGGPHNLSAMIHNDLLATKSAAIIDFLLIIGILFAIMLTDRTGRIKLQIFGFIGCAAGLFLATFSSYFQGSMQIFFIFIGFMVFNFMTNLGPNAQTYLLSGEVFPTHLRGKGAGFAASFAKVGAVLSAFLFPVLIKDLGTDLILYFLTGFYLLGAWITWRFRIETKGINLEKINYA